MADKDAQHLTFNMDELLPKWGKAIMYVPKGWEYGLGGYPTEVVFLDDEFPEPNPNDQSTVPLGDETLKPIRAKL